MLPPAPPSWRARASVGAVVAAGTMAGLLVAGPGLASVPTTMLLVAAYTGLLLAVVGAASLDRRLVVGLGAALILLATIRPPMQSHDVWSYVMYGRIVSQHHASPYTHVPAAFRSDPFLERVDPLWRHSRSVYGPLFTAMAAVLTFISGSNALVARLGFQVAAALAVFLAAGLVSRRTRGDPRALALVLLNPLVIFSLVNDAHVDVFVGLAILGAVLLLERRHGKAAGFALGIGVVIKVIALLPAGAIALWLLSHRSRRPLFLPVVLTLIATVSAGYIVGGGRSAIQPVLDSSTHISGASAWTPVVRAEIDSEEREGDPPSAARTAAGRTVSRIATIAVLGLTVALALAWRRDDDPLLVAGGAVLAYTLAAAYVYPWYLAGGVFVLAIRRRTPLAWLLLAEGAILQVAVIPGRQFTTFVHRQERLPDPAWHVAFRNWGAPVLELVLVTAFVAVVARQAIRSRPPRA